MARIPRRTNAHQFWINVEVMLVSLRSNAGKGWVASLRENPEMCREAL